LLFPSALISFSLEFIASLALLLPVGLLQAGGEEVAGEDLLSHEKEIGPKVAKVESASLFSNEALMKE